MGAFILYPNRIAFYILPLFGFMSRHVKRNVLGRSAFCCLFIVIHYLDIRFIVYPNFLDYNKISINEYILLLSFTLIIVPLIVFKIMKYKIIPENDPRYSESKIGECLMSQMDYDVSQPKYVPIIVSIIVTIIAILIMTVGLVYYFKASLKDREDQNEMAGQNSFSLIQLKK